MKKKKHTRKECLALWRRGYKWDRGYIIGKPNDTPKECAEQMSLFDVEIIDIKGSIKGTVKTGHIIVISKTLDSIPKPYFVDITDEEQWGDAF